MSGGLTPCRGFPHSRGFPCGYSLTVGGFPVVIPSRWGVSLWLFPHGGGIPCGYFLTVGVFPVVIPLQ